MNEDKLKTVREVSRKYNVKEATIRSWTYRVREPLKVVRRGKYMWIDEDVFLEFLKRHPLTESRNKKGCGKTVWTEEKLEKLKQLAGTMSYENIAKKLGISRFTIASKARQLDLPKYVKPKKKRSYLPEYPDDKRFYLNYQSIRFFYERTKENELVGEII